MIRLAILLLAVSPALPPTQPPNLCALALHRVGLAITTLEGVRPVLNNPGGIVDRRGRPVRFRSLAEGKNAMTKMLHARRNLRLRRLVLVWTGYDYPGYASYVSKQAGIALDERICK